MPDHRKLLLISVLVLTALLFINFFFISEYLPEHIPDTPINISGLFWVVCIWILFHVVFKRILKQDDTISLAFLTVFGGLIVLFSELIFQTYRLTTIEDISDKEAIRSFLIAVVGLPLFSSFFAFPTALDLKVKNRALTTFVNIGIGVLLYFSAPYILSFIKGE